MVRNREEKTSLTRLAADFASIIPSVDAETEGQYGSGIGSESEERQVELILDALDDIDESYRGVKREVAYPDRPADCDIVFNDGTPIEAKLLRYWRANGDPEPHWYKHIFSPFNRNTLLTDSKRLCESDFEQVGGLLGLFYQRTPDDSVSVEESPERFTASALAEKVVRDIEYWYGYDAEVCGIESFSGLQHSIHRRGSVITWSVDST
jgi:hypothetical protein